MNLQDFQRNFQGSWFAVDYAFLRPFVEYVKPECQDYYKIPCIRPRATREIERGMEISIECVLPLRDKKGSICYQAALANGILWKEDMDEAAAFDTRTPIVGMVQCGPDLAYVTVSPVRGTPRGFCLENCNVITVSSSMCLDYADSIGRTGKLGYEGVWDVFNPVKSSLTSAYEAMAKGEIRGAALSRHLGVSLAEKRKYPILVYKGRECGNVIDPSTVVLNDGVSAHCLKYVKKHLSWVDIR